MSAEQAASSVLLRGEEIEQGGRAERVPLLLHATSSVAQRRMLLERDALLRRAQGAEAERVLLSAQVHRAPWRRRLRTTRGPSERVFALVVVEQRIREAIAKLFVYASD